jgi:hypothetical protein
MDDYTHIEIPDLPLGITSEDFHLTMENLQYLLHQIEGVSVLGLPNTDALMKIVRHYEQLAISTGEYDPYAQKMTRIAAEAVRDLRDVIQSMHDDLFIELDVVLKRGDGEDPVGVHG